MAKTKPNRRPTPAPASNARRLGATAQRPTPSAGAQRRAARAHKQRANLVGWIAIGLVLVVVAVFIVVKLTSGSPTPKPSANVTTAGESSGQNPALASVQNMVRPVTTIPAAVFNAVGTGGQPNPFTVTKNQPALKQGGLTRFVYQGAEYCPYCAGVRWSMVAALARFGSFSGLRQTYSGTSDGNVPTFSFLGSTYTSKYLAFTPYEYLDRNQSPLQSVPSDVQALYTKYDGNINTATKAPIFNASGEGIPFVDIGNRFVSSGAPAFIDPVLNALYGGGPGPNAVASALHDPSSAVGTAISAKLLIVLANYMSGAICNADGQQPASVCTSPGVMAAKSSIAKTPAVG